MFRLPYLLVANWVAQLQFEFAKKQESKALAKIEDNFATVRHLMLNCWLRLEITLDLCNSIFLLIDDGHTLGTQLPVSLKPKIALFKKAHQKIGIFSALAQEADEIAVELRRLSIVRHDVTHGLKGATAPDGSTTFSRIRSVGDTWQTATTTYSVNDLTRAMTEISDLEARINRHHDLLRDIITETLNADDANNLLG
ncbi:hypothetical protein B9T07_26650 [Limnospira fusiformis CCALA 023]